MQGQQPLAPNHISQISEHHNNCKENAKSESVEMYIRKIVEENKWNLESNEIPILDKILRSPALTACKISHCKKNQNPLYNMVKQLKDVVKYSPWYSSSELAQWLQWGFYRSSLRPQFCCLNAIVYMSPVPSMGIQHCGKIFTKHNLRQRNKDIFRNIQNKTKETNLAPYPIKQAN